MYRSGNLSPPEGHFFVFGSKKSRGPEQDAANSPAYPGQGELYAASSRRRRPFRHAPRWVKAVTAVVSVLLLGVLASWRFTLLKQRFLDAN